MNQIEKLFALGNVSQEVIITGVHFHLTVLNSKQLQDALNASIDPNPDAQALSYQKQILARAITQVDDQNCIEKPNDPTKIEVESNVNGLLNNLHYSVITELFKRYDLLDKSVAKEIDKDIKKSLAKTGAV